MKKALEMNIYGIKCDACDWKDMGVKVEEYDDWLNKPCPKCGANVLTQEDLDSTKLLIQMAELINKLVPDQPDDTEIAKAKIKMNGTGAIDFEIELAEGHQSTE